MIPHEQLRREKFRAIAIAIIELTLGAIMTYVGFQLFNLSELWRLIFVETSGYYSEQHIEFYNAIFLIIISGGIFVLIHGIKRIVDNILNAWVKSAIEEPQHEQG